MRPLLMIPALFAGVPALAATLPVGPGATYTTVQAAIDAAADGDEITVAAGRYDEALRLADLDVTLRATGAVQLATTDDSVVRIDGGTVALEGFTILPQGGRGVRVSAATVTLTDITVRDNDVANAPYNGAAVGIFGGSTVTIDRGTFSGNTTRSNPNPAVSQGQGGHIFATDASLTIRDSAFSDGEGVRGGAIYIDDGSLLVEDSSFARHEATDRGGTIFLTGDVDATLRDTTLTEGTTPGNGAGIRWEGTAQSDLTLERVTLSGHTSGSFGGAVSSNGGGILTLVDAAFTGNAANNGGGMSLFQVDGVVATRTAFCANTASEAGGAVRLNAVGVSSWTNVLLAEGSAAEGAGMWLEDSDQQTLSFVDMVANDAPEGAGLLVDGTTAVVANTMIVGQRTGLAVEVVGGGSATLDYDAWFDNRGGDVDGATQGTGTINAPAQLFRLFPDGLCNDDLRRRSTSPLIDAADPTLTDPDGTRADIGALGGPSVDPAFFDDLDGDGAIARSDCDDDDDTVFPGATEVCDGADNDCDGVVDGANATGADDWYVDADEDGYGDDDTVVRACDAPDGTIDRGRDCDDTDSSINPGADEFCDEVDNDCDGDIDERGAVDPATWYRDDDGDGVGVEDQTARNCNQPENFSAVFGDCDDTRDDVFPAADELCDDLDNDCDDEIDEDPVDPTTWFQDADGDGFGGAASATLDACDQPTGYRPLGNDCDDTDAEISPVGVESCEEPLQDRNCDGFVGTDDNDGDGFIACEDCDDGDPQTYPGAPELWYDGDVRDCTSLSDYDADRDGVDSEDYGGTDCDDADPRVRPGVREIPGNGIDDDCDGESLSGEDEGEQLTAACDGCDGTGGQPAFFGLIAALAWTRRRR